MFFIVFDEDGELMIDEVIKDNFLFVVVVGYEIFSNMMVVVFKYLVENFFILI